MSTRDRFVEWDGKLVTASGLYDPAYLPKCGECGDWGVVRMTYDEERPDVMVPCPRCKVRCEKCKVYYKRGKPHDCAETA